MFACSPPTQRPWTVGSVPSADYKARTTQAQQDQQRKGQGGPHGPVQFGHDGVIDQVAEQEITWTTKDQRGHIAAPGQTRRPAGNLPPDRAARGAMSPRERPARGSRPSVRAAGSRLSIDPFQTDIDVQDHVGQENMDEADDHGELVNTSSAAVHRSGPATGTSPFNAP